MKYVVELSGSRVVVELTSDGVRVDGAPLTAHLADIAGTPIHLVTIGNAVHRVAVRRSAQRGRYSLWLDGFRFDVEALDERTRTIRDMTAANARPAGPAPVLAPMPGLVVRVDARVGDQVHAGQGLVVMEAMKMENELRAPAGGTVKAVLVAAGMAVEKGAVLVELE
ncbi:MAG: acetyl-CoA carboxylase biotin carboxyl carrier protein subunit [Gemmatimonadaceae bacterium]